MVVGTSKFLGLAITDRAILLAEVHVAGERRSVRRTAEFSLSAGLSWDKPEALGAALRSLLRKERFSASRAVVGVPARWLLASEKEIPPSTPQVAADALRLQAERLFSPELKDLAFDYAGQSDPRNPRKVLLVAIPRPHLERIERFGDTAGLSILAITPAAFALNAAINQSADNGVSLVLGTDAAELFILENGTPRLLRHLPISALHADGLATVGTEIKRTASLTPLAAMLPRSLSIWDAIGLDSAQTESLTQRTGMQVHLHTDLALLGIESSNGTTRKSGQFGPAVALALAAAKPELLSVDFLHSRLTPPKAHRIGRRAVWAAILTTTAVVTFALLAVDVRQKEADLADLKNRLNLMQPDVRDAESIAGRVSFARGWYETRPPFLQCLKEISAAFPDDGQLWAGNLSIRDNRRGQLAGRAVDQRSVLALLDRLKNNKKFADVKLQDMREAAGNRREVSFSLNFSFIAVE